MVKLILNGGIKTCCSTTPVEVVKEAVRSWLPPGEELIVIDKTVDDWKPEGLAVSAEKHLGESMFPLVYIGEKLAMICGIPNKKNLLGMVEGNVEYGISEKDIIETAKVLMNNMDS